MTTAPPDHVAEPLLACPRCGAGWADLREGVVMSCVKCGLKATWAPPCFQYGFHDLLRTIDEKSWLRHQALQNNGYIAYTFLQKGSLSLPDRSDVQEFGRFIAKHVTSLEPGGMKPVLLDIGSGTLPLPGYLEPVRQHTLIGLDPYGSPEFPGLMIIGCCEFLPLVSASVNAVVFGTSFDHLMDYRRSIDEIWRVLQPGGRVLIWMGDRSNLVTGIPGLGRRAGWRRMWRHVRHAWIRYWTPMSSDVIDPDRFVIFPNNVVLPIPDGAVDPFHTAHEYPAWVRQHLEERGFVSIDEALHGPDLVLLAFMKPG